MYIIDEISDAPIENEIENKDLKYILIKRATQATLNRLLCPDNDVLPVYVLHHI